MYAGAIPAGSKVTVSMKLKGETEDGYIRLSAATFDQKGFENLAQKMTSQAFKVTKWSDGHMEGTVSSKEGQMLMLSIPYDEGWKIKVDGVPEDPDDLEIIGFGLTGIYLEEGDHEISMHYTPPGYVMGRNISLISLGIFILICIGTYLGEKKKKRVD